LLKRLTQTRTLARASTRPPSLFMLTRRVIQQCQVRRLFQQTSARRSTN
jgi:hypothetical protein